MLAFQIFFFILIAYFFGSISSAIVVCRLMRLPDPRTQGSKNPGATNVLRIGGKTAATITLLGDLLKGLLPVCLAKYAGLSQTALIFVAFAAFLGHLYPIFFGFVGGKGVATLLGCLLALSLPTGMAWIITWLIVAAIFRYSSLAALIATLLSPLYIGFFTGSRSNMLILFLMAILLIYRHQQNILNLWHGQERKIGQNKK
ncbi:MAG: glycerol-3-phosphate acyltransferase [Gammaproteobacteria bacterium RIFCSPHIGHO2_12_FULL_38_14]|nr:MAG: glycerol-3-phosphate acyltransferase [Gammaproteobacteria bacterium RIFCSPHIGHO2_12_FULL_38_14]